MSDHRDIAAESRTLTIQAAVFRALRERGLEPELSDTLASRVPPSETLEEQILRVLVSTDIVTDLRNTIGLDELERVWVYAVVDAACRRRERRRQPQATSSRSTTAAAQPARVATNTATTTTVVFRRRIGGGHG